jgi:hypothetical protein
MASPLSQTSRQTTSDRLYFRTVPSKTIVVARSFSLDSEDTNAVSDPAPDGPSHSPPTGAVPLCGKRSGASMPFNPIEIAGIATIVLSVAALVVVVLSVW